MFSSQAIAALTVEAVLAPAIPIAAVIIYKAKNRGTWYHSVSKQDKLWLYPAVVLLHTALDVPAAMYQTGVKTNIAVVYGIITVFVALIVFITKRIHYRGTDT